MAKVAKAAPSTVPWWIGQGDEECAHCGGTYVLHLEFRCTQCDGPTCPHCKVKHAEGHFVCPECAEERSDG